MSSDGWNAAEVRASLAQALGRELSTATVLLHSAVAERLGLQASDHKAFDVLLRHGPMTAGQLATWLGFTSAAATGVIDRLERLGYARRTADPKDRRKVIVAPIRERAGEIYELLRPLADEVEALTARYSDAEVRVIHDFVTHMVATLDTLMRSIRSGTTE